MRRVTYAGQTFLTSDDMAAALVDFTARIARETSSQAVSVPSITTTGDPVTVDLVIGPSSEVISIPDDSTATIDIGTAADELRSRARAFASSKPHNALPIDDAEVTREFDDM